MISIFGGFAFAKEYDIERKWREVRLYQTAPISTNLILAYLGQHVLGMSRSYRRQRGALLAARSAVAAADQLIGVSTRTSMRRFCARP
jgi:hypothetical protein